MDNAENKILAGDLEPTHAKRSFQVPRVPREKHYNDSLSRQSRRFKNPNKRPNVMQVDHLTTAVGFQWLLHAGALCVARPVLDRFPNKQIQLNISTEWIFGSIGEQSWCTMWVLGHLGLSELLCVMNYPHDSIMIHQLDLKTVFMHLETFQIDWFCHRSNMLGYLGFDFNPILWNIYWNYLKVLGLYCHPIFWNIYWKYFKVLPPLCHELPW